jgi:HEAT repeat-containing protein 5
VSQAVLEKQLLSFISSSDPRPTKPIASTIARILVLLNTYGESRSLFDNLSALQAVFNKKKEEELSVKL